MTPPNSNATMAVGHQPGSRLAIVVPMYNEIAGAEICVRKILSVISTLDVPTELIVVDDGSRDGTGALLDDLQRKPGKFTVVHTENGGYGRALVAGARAAHKRGNDYVLFMDSDLTNPPEHMARFVPPIRRGVDLIKGSRFCRGGDMNAVPWRRRVFSMAGNLVARTLFRMGVADCTNGFRAIRAQLYLGMPLKERGFPIILEELYWAKRAGATVVEVPTSLSSRAEAQRPTSFAYRPAVIWRYLKYALRASTFAYRPGR